MCLRVIITCTQNIRLETFITKSSIRSLIALSSRNLGLLKVVRCPNSAFNVIINLHVLENVPKTVLSVLGKVSLVLIISARVGRSFLPMLISRWRTSYERQVTQWFTVNTVTRFYTSKLLKHRLCLKRSFKIVTTPATGPEMKEYRLLNAKN